MDDYAILFEAVHPSHHATWLMFADRFMAGEELQCLQLVWPDRAGRYPADEEFDATLAPLQPRLAVPE